MLTDYDESALELLTENVNLNCFGDSKCDIGKFDQMKKQMLLSVRLLGVTRTVARIYYSKPMSHHSL